MPAAIDAMVGDGELQEAERRQCVHWTLIGGTGRQRPAALQAKGRWWLFSVAWRAVRAFRYAGGRVAARLNDVGHDVRQAVVGAGYALGDKVICAEWFDDSPLPAPRWYSERLTAVLDAVENDNLTRTLERITDDVPRDPAFIAPPLVPQNRMAELTDNDLLHAVMGVAT